MTQGYGLAELFSIAGKVAVVTGGSRGIGEMIARGLVENGVRTYVSSRKAEPCEATAAELSEAGECIAVPADLATGEGRRRLVEAVGERESRVDVLVNNAGAAWGAPFEEYPESGYDKVMDINVKGPFFLTQGFLPLLEAGASDEDPARVINVGSIDGLKVPMAAQQNYAYGPSKAAIHHLTRVLAMLLAPRRIAVNAIAPGPFESKMTEWTFEKFRGEVEKSCPLGRIGRPADMAGLAVYLASPAASYVTGTVIPVDGGLCLT